MSGGALWSAASAVCAAARANSQAGAGSSAATGKIAVRGSVLAAKRLLNPPSGTNEKVIAFAIELLSDRAIALPGWETTAKPPELLTAVTEPGDIAAELSRQGIAVVMAALSEDGQLVRVSAQDGRLGPVVREPAAVFSRDRLRAWTKDYPYRYGIDEDTGNAFLLSMDGLGMSDLPNGRIVLVMDTDLQQIPANLLRVGDGFAGAAIPIASASSLAWLNAARKADMGKGARAAWISTSEKDGQTLAMIADRLGETFTQHAVTLHTGSDPPQGLVGAELVVVAAHGGLLPEKRYFQRVSDEGHSTFPTSEFADALRNVGVIILFVCSGGRADKHPDASTVVGLAKQLLDRGCTAVVASPWPLNSSVPPHWLPAFLNAWQGEVPLVNAVFEANKAVAKALGDKVAYALAMTVYGDPLRRAISK
jgi:CHAT domain